MRKSATARWKQRLLLAKIKSSRKIGLGVDGSMERRRVLDRNANLQT
jgi:hypothetical protein